jgi:dethiobiotin synthetase
MGDHSSERSAAAGIFVTSVGTGIGKTLVTAILCEQLMRQGHRVRAIKPVVSGFSPEDPFSDPALILRSLGRAPTPRAIEAIAPWRFTAPLSPHLAARREGKAIRFDDVIAFCRDQAGDDGLLLIEGAGGVMAPVDDAHTSLDLMTHLGFPVILVTGTYLGTLSHTLTALTALHSRGLATRGIVVSESEQSAGLTDTVESLVQFAGRDVPVYPLPRLTGPDQEKWRSAPSLTALCGV